MKNFQIEASYNKVFNPATYKQYKYLSSFENVEIDMSISQFTKRITIDQASDAIDAAKSGAKVEIWG